MSAPAVAAPEQAVPRRSWRARWLGVRNGLIASPRFQRWAAGFPLTRRVARANTRALFDLCAGFVYAQVLFACVRLDLFRILADGPLGIDSLSPRLGLTPERTLRLLRAAASLRLVTALDDDRFALADLGAALLGNPAVAAMIEHHAMLYADLADPVALLRGEAGALSDEAIAGSSPDGATGRGSRPTRLSQYWRYSDHARLGEASAESVAAYSSLMGASQALIAGDVLDAVSLDGRACLLDVGGGEGAFAAAAAHRHPRLRLMLFDLAPVAERARGRLAERGLEARVACLGGSFHHDPLPRGADALSLVRILHDHDDAAALALLRAAHAALPPGGLLLVAEPMSGTAGAEPIGDAYFGFYLLAMGSGRARRADELARMLAEAGFRNIRERPTRRPLLVRLLTATRGADV